MLQQGQGQSSQSSQSLRAWPRGQTLQEHGKSWGSAILSRRLAVKALIFRGPSPTYKSTAFSTVHQSLTACERDHSPHASDQGGVRKPRVLGHGTHHTQAEDSRIRPNQDERPRPRCLLRESFTPQPPILLVSHDMPIAWGASSGSLDHMESSV